jgi:hypothetical protein
MMSVSGEGIVIFQLDGRVERESVTLSVQAIIKDEFDHWVLKTSIFYLAASCFAGRLDFLSCFEFLDLAANFL